MADIDAYWSGGRAVNADTTAYWVGGKIYEPTKVVVGGLNIPVAMRTYRNMRT